MANVFVTGGSGFIGGYLLDALQRAGHRCWCLSRDPPQGGAGDSEVEWIRGGLGDTSAYEPFLRKMDGVIHLAGLIAARRRSDYHHTNVVGTERLLKACQRAGSRLLRFVHVSTIGAMGPGYDGGLLRESDRCQPVSEYGASKLESERVAGRFASRIPLVILRPSFVYGVGDDRGAMYLRAVLGPRQRAWKSNIKEFSVAHVEDVARSCVVALERDGSSGEVFIIAEPAAYRWEDLSEIFRDSFDRLALEHGLASGDTPSRLLDRALRLGVVASGLDRYQYWGCDTSKACKLLEFETRRSVRRDAPEVVFSYLSRGLLSAEGRPRRTQECATSGDRA